MHSSVERIPPSAAGPPQQHPWICDHCNVASFATYEEAVAHEEICAHNPAVIRRRGGRVPGVRNAPEVDDVYSSSSVAHSLLSMSRSRSDVSAGASSEHETNLDKVRCYSGSMKLSLEDSDREWLSELNCYIRKSCIEVFSADAEDVKASSKRGRIVLNQVGLRCVFCKGRKGDSHDLESKTETVKEADSSTTSESSPDEIDSPEKDGGNDSADGNDKANAAISFPSTLSGIYESIKRWHSVHLPACAHVPVDVKTELDSLANSKEWVPTTRQYWIDSAAALGLVDTAEGIRFSRDPKSVHDEVRKISRVPSGEETEPGTGRNGGGYRMDHLHAAVVAGASPAARLTLSSTAHSSPRSQQPRLHQTPFPPGAHIVHSEDMEMIPPYVYFLMRQVEPCLFTEADRFVARSKGPVGYPGFQCRHCNGHAGLGKYFPVS